VPLGLGLAIAQQFVQAMGGQLELKNGIPHGTKFSFTLTLQWAQKSHSIS
jgi:signal transduction histidine kinase